MKLIISVALYFVLLGPSLAVENSDVARCAAIQGDLDRLQCFDNLAALAGLDTPQTIPVEANPGDVGKWVVARKRNPIDDSETVTVSLFADSGKSRWGTPVVFQARCQSNNTEAYIAWDDYLGNDGTFQDEFKMITLRVGKSPAVTRKWDLSTDSKATFAPEWAGDLLKEMAAADSFLAQVIPYGESPTTAIFDTTGMAAALKPLAEVCGWQL